MCGCGRTSPSVVPGLKCAGPMWSRKTKGPTLRWRAAGNRRRTVKPMSFSWPCKICSIAVIGTLHEGATRPGREPDRDSKRPPVDGGLAQFSLDQRRARNDRGRFLLGQAYRRRPDHVRREPVLQIRFAVAAEAHEAAADLAAVLARHVVHDAGDAADLVRNAFEPQLEIEFASLAFARFAGKAEAFE